MEIYIIGIIILVVIVIFGIFISHIIIDHLIGNLQSKIYSFKMPEIFDTNKKGQSKKEIDVLILKAEKLFSYKMKVKLIFGVTGIVFGTGAALLTLFYFWASKKTDTIMEILTLLNNINLENINSDDISSIIEKYNALSSTSSAILMYSGLSQILLLSIVTVDLFSYNSHLEEQKN